LSDTAHDYGGAFQGVCLAAHNDGCAAHYVGHGFDDAAMIVTLFLFVVTPLMMLVTLLMLGTLLMMVVTLLIIMVTHAHTCGDTDLDGGDAAHEFDDAAHNCGDANNDVGDTVHHYGDAVIVVVRSQIGGGCSL
jgi:hypothetical protein